MQENSLSDYPSYKQDLGDTRFKRSVSRILAGEVLFVIILNFWIFDIILPLIGVILMMLGFRALKNESRAFKICFFISAAQTALLIFNAVVNASVLRADFESSSAFTVLKVISTVLKFIILCCQTAGIYDLQEKAGIEKHAGGAAAFVIWYVLLVFFAVYPVINFVFLIVFIILLGFVIRSMYKLYRELADKDFNLTVTQSRISDAVVVSFAAAAVVVGVACCYLFLNGYKADWQTWQPPSNGGDAELEKISTHLAGLGFPENVLGDLQAQDLRDCAGALRVVVKQDDYPGNKGRKVTEKTETGYRETVIYDTENLHITSVAVELSRDNRQWRIFHHFSWTSNLGFCGTDAVIVCPAYSFTDSWMTPYNDRTMESYDISGHMLYDKVDTSYAAPYHFLGDTASVFGRGNITAEFSMPESGENHRGYISYTAMQSTIGSSFADSIEYVHQTSRFCYPVVTAAHSRQNTKVFFTPDVFYKTSGTFQFWPYDDAITNRAA